VGDDEDATVGMLVDDVVEARREAVGGLDRVLAVGQVVGHWVGAEGVQGVREAVSHRCRG
jgi:hypothetical protein